MVVTEGGKVPLYITSMASAEGAFSIGNRFTILPKFYLGYYHTFDTDPLEAPRNYMNPKHYVTVGGFMQDRYSCGPPITVMPCRSAR